MEKRFILLTVLTLSFVSLTGCKNNVDSRSFEQKLKDLQYVTSVEKLENKTKNVFKDKYKVMFTQPIDWDNPEAGTFEQLVYVCYKSDSAVNEYYCDGYNAFSESNIVYTEGDELSEYFDANFINIEYRFFVNSVPDGFEIGGTEFYEYLTYKNACKDFHRIITSLSTILKGKRIFTGHSKGGYTTECMAYYFPNDIESYVSYVAPLCNGTNDLRLNDFVYHSIGDEVYGKTKAQEYRDILKEFQKNALDEKFRTTIMSEIFDNREYPSRTLKTLTDDELYEFQVVEIPVGVWMYTQDFSSYSIINKLPETTAQEITTKANKIAQKMLNFMGPIDRYVENYLTPYYVQAYTEMGNYAADLDCLREFSDNVKTDKSRTTLHMESTITADQIKMCEYTSAMNDALYNFLSTTDKTIIKIIGLSDPWSSVAYKETTNENIHFFTSEYGHQSTIETLDTQQMHECFNLIESLVK